MALHGNDKTTIMELWNSGSSINGRCSAGKMSIAILAAFVIIVNFLYIMPPGYVNTFQMIYIDDNSSVSDSPSLNTPRQDMAALGMLHIPVRTSLSSSESLEIKYRFAERLDHLHSSCQKKKPGFISEFQKRVTLSKVAGRSEVLNKYKVMFCEVYKAGSTAWNSLMAHLYQNKKVIETEEFYRMQQLLKPNLKLFAETLSDPTFVRLVVAREPLSRLLSAYRDRIEDTSHPSWQGAHFIPLILKYTRNKTYPPNELYYANRTIKIVPTFEEFARYLTGTGPSTYDPHWKPVSIQCDVCNINYTHIIHTESFIDDVRYILRVTGLDQKIDASLLTLNAHKGRGNTTNLMVHYYSTLKPQTLQKIVEIYKDDFVLFDYNPTQLLKAISPNTTIHF